MQPNTYLQPNTYYQVQPAPKPPKEKSSTGAIIAAVIFALIAVGLGVFILLDKLVFSKNTGDDTVTTARTSINTPLSEVEIPEGAAEDVLKNVLAERTFTVNDVVDQYVTFKNDSEFVYSYYRTPSVETDHHQNVPSEQHGTYIVKDKTITLSSGDEFTITGDYLVKSTDKLSTNKNTVYFDINQLPTFKKGFANSLTDFLKESQKNPNQIVKDYAVQKAEIASYSCTVDRKHMAKADNYICDTEYVIYFNSKDIKNSEVPFTDFCKSIDEIPAVTDIVSDCISIPEVYMGSFTMHSYLIVRIKNAKYEITGSFINETDAPEPEESEEPEDDESNEE